MLKVIGLQTGTVSLTLFNPKFTAEYLVGMLKRSNFALAFGDYPTGIPGAVAGATAANEKKCLEVWRNEKTAVTLRGFPAGAAEASGAEKRTLKELQ